MQVEKMLNTLKGIAERHGITSLENIDKWEYSVKVAFLGEFSSGKTSILNALIGKNLFPVFSHPTNAIVTEVYKSMDTEDHFYILRTNENGEVEEYEIELADIPEEIKKADPNKVLRAFINVDFLPNDIILIDTPGVSSLEKLHEDILLSYLPMVDVAFIVVDSAMGGLTASLKKFLTLFPDFLLSKMYILLNKIDLIDPSKIEEVTNSTKSNLNEVAPDIKIIPVSAKWALEGIVSHDTQKLESSRILKVKDLIKEEIPTHKREIYRERLKETLVKKAKDIRSALQLKLQNISLTDEELDKEINKISKELEYLDGEYRRFLRKISRLHEKSTKEIEEIIDRGIEIIRSRTITGDDTSLIEEDVKNMLYAIEETLRKNISELEDMKVPGFDGQFRDYINQSALREIENIKQIVETIRNLIEVILVIWLIPGSTKGVDLYEVLVSSGWYILNKFGETPRGNGEPKERKITEIIRVLKKIDPLDHISKYISSEFVKGRLIHTIKPRILGQVNKLWDEIEKSVRKSLTEEYINPIKERQEIMENLRTQRALNISNAISQKREIEEDISTINSILSEFGDSFE